MKCVVVKVMDRGSGVVLVEVVVRLGEEWVVY